MTKVSRSIFLTSLFLIPMATPILRAQETHEKETKTVEKEKPTRARPAASQGRILRNRSHP